jgi:hypothetical protein
MGNDAATRRGAEDSTESASVAEEEESEPEEEEPLPPRRIVKGKRYSTVVEVEAPSLDWKALLLPATPQRATQMALAQIDAVERAVAKRTRSRTKPACAKRAKK